MRTYPQDARFTTRRLKVAQQRTARLIEALDAFGAEAPAEAGR